MQKSYSIVGKRCATTDEINEQIQIIANQFRPEKIILFGSYYRGNPSPDSDVDLLVIVDTNQSTWEISAEISLALSHAFPLDIVVKTRDDVEKRIKDGDFFLRDVIENGKIVYERVGARVD